MKNSENNILKRFLKRKKKITEALIVVFMITGGVGGSALAGTITGNGVSCTPGTYNTEAAATCEVTESGDIGRVDLVYASDSVPNIVFTNANNITTKLTIEGNNTTAQNIMFTNSGTIDGVLEGENYTAGTNERYNFTLGIRGNYDNTYVKVKNEVGATISGTAPDGFTAVVSLGGNKVNFENQGTISKVTTGLNGGSISQVMNIRTINGLFTNGATGLIEHQFAQNTQAEGIVLRNFGPSSFEMVNDGQILVTALGGAQSTVESDVIRSQLNLNLLNRGTISTNATNVRAIRFRSGRTGTLTNEGLINADLASAVISDNASNNVNILNSGTISTGGNTYLMDLTGTVFKLENTGALTANNYLINQSGSTGTLDIVSISDFVGGVKLTGNTSGDDTSAVEVNSLVFDTLSSKDGVTSLSTNAIAVEGSRLSADNIVIKKSLIGSIATGAGDDSVTFQDGAASTITLRDDSVVTGSNRVTSINTATLNGGIGTDTLTFDGYGHDVSGITLSGWEKVVIKNTDTSELTVGSGASKGISFATTLKADELELGNKAIAYFGETTTIEDAGGTTKGNLNISSKTAKVVTDFTGFTNTTAILNTDGTTLNGIFEGQNLSFQNNNTYTNSGALSSVTQLVVDGGQNITTNFYSAILGTGTATTPDYISLVTSIDPNDSTNLIAGLDLSWVALQGDAHGDFSIGAGKTFTVDEAGVLADRTGTFASTWDGKSLTKKGTGTLAITAAQSFTGATKVEAGILTLSGDNDIIGSSTSVDVTGTLSITDTSDQKLNNLTGSGNLTSSTGVLTLNNTVATTDDTTFTGVITNTKADASGVVKTGAGKLTLSGVNAITKMSVNSGELALNNATGDVLSGTAINNNSTLSIENNQSIGDIYGTGITALTGNLTVTAGSGSSLSGVVSGSGGLSLTGGSLTLGGANTFTGGATIASGTTLTITDISGLGTGAATNNGTLVVNAGETLANALSGSSTALTRIAAGNTVALSGDNSGFAGTWDILGTLNVDSESDLGVGSTTAGLQVVNKITGDGTLAFDLGTANTLNFTNTAGSDFTGRVEVSGGAITLDTDTVNFLNGGDGSKTNLVLNSTASSAINETMAIGDLTLNGGSLSFAGTSDSILYVGSKTGTGATTSGDGVLTLVDGTNSTITVSSNDVAGSGLASGNLLDIDNGGEKFKLIDADSISGTGTISVATAAGDNKTTTTVGSYYFANAGSTGYINTTTANIYAETGALTKVNVSSDQTLALNTTGATDTTFGAQLTGSGNLSTAGDITLNNTRTDTGLSSFTGTTTVTSGTLTLGANDNLGQTSNLAISEAATFDMNGNNQRIGVLSGTGTLKLSGLGSLNIDKELGSGDSTFAGIITGSGGILGIGTDRTLTLSNGASDFSGSTAIVPGGGIILTNLGALGTSTITTDGTLTLNAGGDFANKIMAGDVDAQNLELGIVSISSGNTVSLSGDNTLFKGAWNVDGTLTVDTESDLGAEDTTAGLQVANKITGAGTLTIDLTNEATKTLNFTSGVGSDFGGTLGLATGTIILDEATQNFLKDSDGAGTTDTTTATLALSGDAKARIDGNKSIGNLTLAGGNLDFTSDTNNSAVVTTGAIAVTAASTLTINGDRIAGNALGTLNLLDLDSGSGDILLVDGTSFTGSATNLTVESTGDSTTDYIDNTVGKYYFGISGDVVVDETDATISAKGGALVKVDIKSGQTLTLNATDSATITSTDKEFTALLTGGGNLSTTGDMTITNENNAFTGTTSVTSGILTAGSNSALGTSSLALGVNTFDLNGMTQSLSGLSGSTGSILMVGGGALTIDTTTATNTFAGVISEGGSLTKSGAGSLTLSGVNTFTGTTEVTGGTLILNNGSALASSSKVTLNGGTLETLGSETLKDITGDNNIALGGVLTVNTGTGSLGGVISDNTTAGGLSLTGGSLTLGGVNTFTGGTTLASGTTLTITDISGLGTGAATNNGTLVVNAGGTLTNALSGSSTALTRITAGNTVALSGDNTGFVGTWDVLGKINIDSESDLGAGSTDAGLQVVNKITGGGTLAFDLTSDKTLNFASTVGSDFTGRVEVSSGAVVIDSATATFLGGTTLDLASTGVANIDASRTIGDLNMSGSKLDFTGDTNDSAILTAGTLNLADGTSSEVTINGSRVSRGGLDSNMNLLDLDTGTVDVKLVESTLLTGTGTVTVATSGTATEKFTTRNGNKYYFGDASTSGKIANNSIYATSGSLAKVDIGTSGLALNTGAVGGVAAATDTTFGAQLTGSGNLSTAGDVTLNNTRIDTGLSSFTGTTTVTSGTLTLGANDNLGQTSNLAISEAATFDMNLMSQRIGGLSGSGNLTLSGALNIDGSRGTGSSTFGGVISGTGSLGVGGGETLTLSNGSSTFSGTTSTVQGSSIILTDLGALGTSTLTNGGNITLNAAGDFTNKITGGGIGGPITELGVVSISSGNAVSLSGDNTLFKGAWNVDGTLTVDTESDLGALDATAGLQVANKVTGAGTLTIDLSSETVETEKVLNFTSGVGSDFGGTLGLATGTIILDEATQNFLKDSDGAGTTDTTTATLALSGDAKARIDGNKSIGNLTLAGGNLDFTSDTNNSAVVTTGAIAVTAASTLTINGDRITENAFGTLNLLDLDSGSGDILLVDGTSFTGSATNLTVESTGDSTTDYIDNTVGKYYFGISGDVVVNETDATISAKGGALVKIDVKSGQTLALNATDSATITSTDKEFTALLTGGGNLSTTGDMTITNENNAFTGTTSVTSGILTAGSSSALGTSSLSLGVNTFDLNGMTQSLSGLSGSTGSSLTTGGGALTIDTVTTTNTFAGVISEGGSLTKSGTGSLTLSGANTFTGTTEVTGGTLILNNGSALASSSKVTLNGGELNTVGAETLKDITGDNNIALGGVLTVNAGTGSLGGVISDNTTAGGLSLTGGSLTLGGVNTFTGGTTLASGTTLTITDISGLGTGAATNNGTLVVNAGGTTGETLANALSGSSTALTRITAGNTVALSGDNSGFVGTWDVLGTINIDSESDLGAGNTDAGLQVANKITGGGTLAFDLTSDKTLNFASTVGSDFTGRVEVSSGAVVIDSATATFLGKTTLDLASTGVANIDASRTIGDLNMSDSKLDFTGDINDSAILTAGTLNLADGTSSEVTINGSRVSRGGLDSNMNLLDLDTGTVDVKLVESTLLTGTGTVTVATSGTATEKFTTRNGNKYYFGDASTSGKIANNSIYATSGSLAKVDIGTSGLALNTGAVGGVAAATDTTFGAQLTGSGNLSTAGDVTLNNTRTDTGLSSFTGTTTVTSGTLTLGANDNLGQTSNLAISEAATFDMNLMSQRIGGLSGSGNLTLSGALNIDGSRGTGSSTFGGVISGTGSLGVGGGETLTLSNGSSTFSGTTSTVQGSSIILTDLGALGTSTLTNGGTITLNAGGDFVNKITGGGIGGPITELGVVSISSGNTVSLSGDNTLFKGAWNVDGTLTVDTESDLGALDTTAGLQVANKITGAGTLTIDLSSETVETEKVLNFTSGVGSDFGGTLGLATGTIILDEATQNFLKDSDGAGTTDTTTANLALSGDAKARIDGNKSIGNLTLAGGNLDFTSDTNNSAVVTTGAIAVTAASTLTINGDRITENALGTLNLLDLDSGSGDILLVDGTSFTGSATNLTVESTGDSTTDYIDNTVGKYYFGISGDVVVDETDATISAKGGALVKIDVKSGQTLTLNATDSATITSTDKEFTALLTGGGNLSTTGDMTITNENNAFTGTTSVTSGILTAGSNSALGTSSLALGVNTFDLNGMTQSLSGLSGSTGSILMVGGGALTIDTTTTTNTFAGVISEGGSLTKSGTGSLTLSGANTFTGTTEVTGGTLILNNGSALASSSKVTLNGGELNTVGAETLKDITGDNNIALGGVLTVNTGTGSLGGVISDNTTAGGLSLTGGSLTLGGTNTFTGGTAIANTTTLTITDISGLGTGAATNNGTLVVNAGGTTGETLANALSGSSTALTRITAGNTVALSGDNSGFVGTWDVLGTINIDSESDLGAGSTDAGLQVVNKITGGGTLAFDLTSDKTLNFASTVGSDFTGRVEVSSGAVVIDSATATFLSGTTLDLASTGVANIDASRTIGDLNMSGSKLDFTGDTNDSAILTAGTLNLADGTSSEVTINGSRVSRGGLDSNMNLLDLDTGTVDVKLVESTLLTGTGTVTVATSGTATEKFTTRNGNKYYFGDASTSGKIVNNSIYATSGSLAKVDIGASGLALNTGAVGGVAAATDTTFGAQLTGSGNLSTAGDITLSNINNNFKGTTTINSGILTLGGNNTLGATNGVVMNTAGVKLDLSGKTQKIGSLNGSATDGEVSIGAGILTIDNSQGAGTSSFAGKLTGTGTLALIGEDLTLSGSSLGANDATSFTGSTTIGGTSKLTINNINGVGSSSVANNGTFVITNGTTEESFTNTLTGSGTTIISGTVSLEGDNTGFDGTWDITGSAKVANQKNIGTGIGDDTNVEFDNNLTGSGTLIISLPNTTDTLTFGGTNAFTGTFDLAQGIATIDSGATTKTITTTTIEGANVTTSGGTLRVDSDSTIKNLNLSGGNLDLSKGTATTTLSVENFDVTTNTIVTIADDRLTGENGPLGNNLLDFDNASASEMLVTASGTVTGDISNITLQNASGATIGSTLTETVIAADGTTKIADLIFNPSGAVLVTEGAEKGLGLGLSLSEAKVESGQQLTFNNAADTVDNSFGAKITGEGGINISAYVDGTTGANNTITITSVNNSFGGVTTINTGILKQGAAGALGQTSLVDIKEDATLDINGHNTTIGALSGAGKIDLVGANGTPADGLALTLNLIDGESNTHSGIISGAGNLVVGVANGGTGTGVQTLSGANTFIGTTEVKTNANLTLGADNTIQSSSEVKVDGRVEAGTTSQTLNKLSGAGALTSTSGVITLNNGVVTTDDTAFSGTISNTNEVKKTGAGKLTLSGVNSIAKMSISGGGLTLNNATGDVLSGTAINNSAGNLSVATNQSVGDISGAGTTALTGNLTVTAGSAVAAAGNTVSGVISGAGGLTLAGGNLKLSGANTFTGETTVANGTTLFLDSSDTIKTSGGVAIAGTVEAGTTSQTLNKLSGAGTLTSTSGVITLNNTTTTTDDTEFSGTISNTNEVKKSGAGKLTLSGVNSIAKMSVDRGELALNNATGDVLSGTAINNSAGNLSVASNQSVGDIYGAGTTALTGNLEVTAGSGAELAGVVSGAGGLNLSGGSMLLSGANTFEGGTTLGSNTVMNITNTSALGSGVVTNGGTINVDATGTLTNAISGSGALNIDSGVVALTGTNTFAGGLNVAKDAAASVASASNLGSGDINLVGGNTANDFVNLDIDSTNAFELANKLTGAGNLSVNTGTNEFSMTSTTPNGTDFTGRLEMTGGYLTLGNNTLSNDTILTGATLDLGRVVSGSGDTQTIVSRGEARVESNTSIGDLEINGGHLAVSGDTTNLSVDNLTVGVSGSIGIDKSRIVGSSTGGLGSNLLDLDTGVANDFVVETTGAITDADVGKQLTLIDNATGKALTIGSSESLYQGGSKVGKSYFGDVAIVYENTTTGAKGIGLSYSLTKVYVAAADSEYTGELKFDSLGASDDTFGAEITGAGGITIDATGLKDEVGNVTDTLILNNSNNNFTGVTKVEKGTLKIGAADVISSSSEVNLASGTTLDLSTVDTNIKGLSGSGSVDLKEANLIITGAETKTFAGNITGSGDLVINGSGEVQLTSGSDFTGTTYVNSGTLNLGATGGDALGATGQIKLGEGAMIALSDAETLRNLDGTGVIANGTNTVTLKNLATTNEGVELSTGVTTFDGSVSGSGDVIKSGAGTMNLGGNLGAGSFKVEEGRANLTTNTAAGSRSILVDSELELSFSNGNFGNTLTNTTVGTGSVLVTGEAIKVTADNTNFTGLWDVTGSMEVSDGINLGNSVVNLVAPTTSEMTSSNLLITGSGTEITSKFSGAGILDVKLDNLDDRLTFANNMNTGETFTGDFNLSSGTLLVEENVAGTLTEANLTIDNSGRVEVTTDQSIGDLTFNGGRIHFANYGSAIIRDGELTVNNLDITNGGIIEIDTDEIRLLTNGVDSTTPLLDADDNFDIQLVTVEGAVTGGTQITVEEFGTGQAPSEYFDVSDGSGKVATATVNITGVVESTTNNLGVGFNLVELAIEDGKTLELNDIAVTDVEKDLSAKITGAGNLLVKTVDSNDTISLSSPDSTFSGSTTVANGTLLLNAYNALGNTSSINLLSGTTLDMGGQTQMDEVGMVAMGTNGTLKLSDGVLNAKDLVASGTSAVDFGNAGVLNLSGQGQVTGDNILTGTGVLNLTTGANVNLSGNNTSSSLDVAVDEGAVLLGSGVLGGNITNSGLVGLQQSTTRAISPSAFRVTGNFNNSGVLDLSSSNAVNDVMTVSGDFVANTGSKIIFDIDASTDGTGGNDRVVVGGTFSGTSELAFNDMTGQVYDEFANEEEANQALTADFELITAGVMNGNLSIAPENQFGGQNGFARLEGSPFVWKLTTDSNSANLSVATSNDLDGGNGGSGNGGDGSGTGAFDLRPTDPNAGGNLIVGPEVAALTSLAGSSSVMASDSVKGLHERLGELRANERNTEKGHNFLLNTENSGFAAWSKGTLSGVDVNGFYDGSFGGTDLGVDYLWDDLGDMDILTGAYVGYRNGSFDGDGSNSMGVEANTEVSTLNFGLYTTLFYKGSWYTDLVLQYGHIESDITADQLIDSTHGEAFTGSVETGYSYNVTENWLIEPQAQVITTVVDTDDTTFNGTKAEFDTETFVTGRVGARTEYEFDLPNNIKVKPYAKASGLYEFADREEVEYGGVEFEGHEFSAGMETGAGVTVQVEDYLSVYGEFDYTTDFDEYDQYRGSFGVRYSF